MRRRFAWLMAVGSIALFVLTEVQAQQGVGTGGGVGTGAGVGTGGGVGTGAGIGTGGGVGTGSGFSGGMAGGMAGGQFGQGQLGGNAGTGGNGYFGVTPTTSSQGGNTKAGVASGIPSASNLFKDHMTNPLSLGFKSGGTPTFAQPLYPTTTTTTTTRTTARVGTGNTTANTAIGFNTFGQLRDLPYAPQLGPDIPLVNPQITRLEIEARTVVKNSSRLPSRDRIAVAVEDGVVVLRGQVGTPRERQLAEDMLRLSPGIRAIRNELTIAP